MLTLLLAVAVLAAMAGAYNRNWTSVALLASFALSTGLCWLQVPFNAALWMVIDTAVAMVILRPGMKRRDWLIVALFAPVWTIYFLDEPAWAPQAVDLIVAGQMLLTFPVRQVWIPFLHKAARFNRTWNPWDGFDLRARHGVA